MSFNLTFISEIGLIFILILILIAIFLIKFLQKELEDTLKASKLKIRRD